MGHFVAISAFQNCAPDALAAAIAADLAELDVKVAPRGGAEFSDADAAIFEPAGGWTIVFWPAMMLDQCICRRLTKRLDTLASTIHVHDGDYWTHVLFDRGVPVDRFASMPGYHEPELQEQRSRDWKGDAARLARCFGVEASAIAPYLQFPDELEDPMIRVFPDDSTDLHDPWVFVDFWRRCGLRYPVREDDPVQVLQISADVLEKLPCSEEDGEL